MSEKTRLGVIVKTKDGVFLHPQAQSWYVDDNTSILIVRDVMGDKIIEYRSYDSVYFPHIKTEQLLQETTPIRPGEFDDVVETRDIPHGPVPEGFTVHAIYQKNLIVKRKTEPQPPKEPVTQPEPIGMVD